MNYLKVVCVAMFVLSVSTSPVLSENYWKLGSTSTQTMGTIDGIEYLCDGGERINVKFSNQSGYYTVRYIDLAGQDEFNRILSFLHLV